MLTKNVYQYSGLCNGATGTVMDIVYMPGMSSHGLPKFIIVDFGTDYRGPTFFLGCPNISGWVPINHITAH